MCDITFVFVPVVRQRQKVYTLVALSVMFPGGIGLDRPSLVRGHGTAVTAQARTQLHSYSTRQQLKLQNACVPCSLINPSGR